LHHGASCTRFEEDSFSRKFFVKSRFALLQEISKHGADFDLWEKHLSALFAAMDKILAESLWVESLGRKVALVDPPGVDQADVAYAEAR
jgi:hypothetical protein